MWDSISFNVGDERGGNETSCVSTGQSERSQINRPYKNICNSVRTENLCLQNVVPRF